MLKSLFIGLVVCSIGLAAAGGIANDAGNRKLKSEWYGPSCTNSYFKSAPNWQPKPGKIYAPCCDKNKGFICATYTGNNKWSTYATCMTKEACKASGQGWNCNPIANNPFPECQYYYGDMVP